MGEPQLSLARLPFGNALEGLDATGKSETVKGLKAAGYTVYKTPPEDMAKRREYFDRDNIPVEDRFFFYLTAVAKVSQLMLAEAKRTICDRHILTTVAAHEALGMSRTEIEDKLLSSGLYIPALSIILVVSEEERNRRLKSRGANANDIANQKINAKLLEGFYFWAQRLGHDIVTLDTTTLTIPEVISEVVQIVENPKV